MAWAASVSLRRTLTCSRACSSNSCPNCCCANVFSAATVCGKTGLRDVKAKDKDIPEVCPHPNLTCPHPNNTDTCKHHLPPCRIQATCFPLAAFYWPHAAACLMLLATCLRHLRRLLGSCCWMLLALPLTCQCLPHIVGCLLQNKPHV